MKDTNNKFYVTTPIYYVTAKPHLGSLYSTVLADVLARFNKMRGKKTFFLTGTDEHGQKIAQAAQLAGKKPQEFVDSFIQDYKTMWQAYNLDYTHFMRTTDAYHVKAVQDWIRKLREQGDIYKSFYEGWYCTPCETFVTVPEHEKVTKGPACTSCGRETAFVSEECYFFKLSAYQDKLLDFYKNNPDFIVPKERLNEVINFVQAGLKDLSISRTTITWGIPFPDDPAHVVYVWADALNNYITGIGYGQQDKAKEFSSWWPADVHILGKDIVRFHAVYWPAFLMASGLPLPKKLLVHGWIKVGDQKMSKSLGNVVDPEKLYHTYGADCVRYYLLRHMSIAQDSSFNIADLEQRIAADLANDLGNLLNRTVTLAHKYEVYHVAPAQPWSEQSSALRDKCLSMVATYLHEMDNYSFHQALAAVWKFINEVNSFFHGNEPWKLAKADTKKFNEVISATVHSLYAIALVLWPVMPIKMEELLRVIGIKSLPETDVIELLRTMPWDKKFVLSPAKNLFEKPEPKKSEEEKNMQPAVETNTDNYITIEDVAKVHLVVGAIEECVVVEQSEKLYQMRVNMGEHGMRTILAGVRASFSREDLLNKQAIFILNLKPRKMVGLESQGMMLVAHDASGKSTLVTVAGPVPNGTRLR